MWRLELGGTAKKSEAIGLWSGVKGVSVKPEGESCHGQARAKMARKERENQTKMGEKVEGEGTSGRGCGGSESEEKVIRMESEETTQDYVRESLNLSLEEVEEMRFVPSASLCFGVTIAAVTKPTDSVSLLVSQRKFDSKGPGAFEELAVGRQSWKRRRIVAGSGECLEKTSKYKECVSTSLLNGWERKSVSRTPRRKSRKGCKANGNVSLLPKNTWNK